MQKVIIIGATSGIGRALAERFLRNGAMAGITGRRKNLLDELQQQYPQQLEVISVDALDRTALLTALAQPQLVISAFSGHTNNLNRHR